MSIKPQKTYKAGKLGRQLDFEDRTFPRILQIQAALGDKLMIKSPNRTLTYAEAPRVAANYAGKLVNAGVKPGDRIVTFVSNKLELLELWMGATWAGAIMVPINTALRGEQLRHAIKTVEPTLIFSESDLVEHLHTVKESLTSVNTVYLLGLNSEIDTTPIDNVPIKQFVCDAKPIPAHAVHPSDIAAILYTSGTTGPSKGVLCPHAQFYWYGLHTAESLGITDSDILYTVLPFFHTNALNSLWQAILCGATYSFSLRFSASKFWKDAADNNASITYLLGAMANILLKRPDSELNENHSIRVALCPATPLESNKQFYKRFGVKLIEGYGSTETNLVFSNVIGGYAPASMGRVVDGFEVRIIDKNGCDVEKGQTGELIIRNREPFSMASGYFGNPTATVKAWKNLWFHTGDLVMCNDEGIYYFVDRLSDSIRRRGENISSWEVESTLMEHPDIETAAVVGVPSDLGSEDDVMTFILPKAGKSIDPLEIIRFLEPRLAYFAIPRYWDIVNELPKTPNGKVKKSTLREQGISDTTWDSERAGIKLKKMT